MLLNYEVRYKLHRSVKEFAMPIQTSRLQLEPRVIRPVADPLGLFIRVGL